MIEIREGGKRAFVGKIIRQIPGNGSITLTVPLRRIVQVVGKEKMTVPNFDWAPADWDPVTQEMSALFDSTLTGLTIPGLYYGQLKGTVGSEIYDCEIKIKLKEWGS